MIQLALHEAHVNRLLGKAQVTYQDGCFVVHRKLPVGAATVVAVPTLEGRELVFYVPFDQAGVVGQVAKVLWGVISDQVLKQASPRLVAMGIPSDALDVSQVTYKGKKAGRLSLSLHRVNEWLARQNGPHHVAVEDLKFERDAVNVTLALR